MRITTRQAIALAQALREMDGEQQPDGTVRRYEFSGKVIYAIARTINATRPLVAAYEKARNDIVAKFSGGKAGLEPGDPNHMACVRELDELLDTEVELEPHRFKLDELALDKNRIRGTTLAGLEPVLLVD